MATQIQESESGNFIQRASGWPLQVKNYFEELQLEMRRVTWPSRQEWVSATILTVALVFVIGLYTYSIDQLFGFLFGLVHK